MARKPFTPSQVMAVQISERTMSVFSILGSFYIMVTFIKWKYFRKPINRLVFYASFGNVMANVATMISTTALPLKGQTPSTLCRFQGIFIQWFMMADSLWVFCMALNVLIVFKSSCDIRRLHRLEKWYLLFAYGLPFTPCLAYLILDHSRKDRVIGGATIWCWVDKRVEWMRIAWFYAPVWFVITMTLSIYVYVGRTIFRQRAELRSLSNPVRTDSTTHVITNPFTFNEPHNIVKHVDMRVTTETIGSEISAQPTMCANESRDSFSSTRNLSNVTQITDPVPAHHEEGRGYQVMISANNDFEPTVSRKSSTGKRGSLTRHTHIRDGNLAAWSYLKVSFLMFAALFIVWVPSTVNRLQQFIHKDNPIFGLNLASALVLPLQGFWNAVIYMSTTWPECKRAYRETLEYIAQRRHPRSRQSKSQIEKDTPYHHADPMDMEAQIALREMLNTDPQRLPSRISSSEFSRPSHQEEQGR
ncbi:family A G protein-coupled receptor-like protein [Aaosphaeria arxii CBS 175.79]|uniref:Family A G protein-coupled receptor-like protein n=1 Tax=Aaosphaeria arxii CBS 175.79 TaxID=1450172 RepID=A0A6A5Y9C0_9PLEO|nr:family A G protein-coupled receptor-like protein [Aaosphaeria arxii CBS 175.79]KAF2022185.1 family A G protein-coupled receptor-like protein [Aaosphaeria arxii CBS 175.79]